MSGTGVSRPVQGLELPFINTALEFFEAKTEGDVRFGPEAAVLNRAEGEERLTSQPAEVKFLGKTVGHLTTVVFNYYDGTGDRSMGELVDMTGDGYFMDAAKIVPRVDEAAQDIHGDVHLPIASFTTGRSDPHRNTNVRLLAGSLSLFGLSDGRAMEIGYLGQDNVEFHEVMSGRRDPEPTATKTISDERLYTALSARFGSDWHHDVRAVYNRFVPISQIAAFIKLDRTANGQVTPAQEAMIKSLGVIEPVQGKPQPRPQALQGR